MLRIFKRLPWIAAGAAAAWFLDPRSGAERRHEARERIAELTNRDEPAAPDAFEVTKHAAA